MMTQNTNSTKTSPNARPRSSASRPGTTPEPPRRATTAGSPSGFYRPPIVVESERRESARRARKIVDAAPSIPSSPPRRTAMNGSATSRVDERALGGWLTVRQAARRLSLCPKYVYSLIYARELDATNFGKRQWRIHEQDIAAFIAARTARRDEDIGIASGDKDARTASESSTARANRERENGIVPKASRNDATPRRRLMPPARTP